MPHSHKSSNRIQPQRNDGFFHDLWRSFWNPPEVTCPKCGNERIEYYDPFFFAPVRTLKGQRRVRCPSCRFIWRQSRHGKTFWELLRAK